MVGIDHVELVNRQRRLMKALEYKSVVIVPAYKTRYSSLNIFYPFQQNNNLLYLTGFNEPDSCLVMRPTKEDGYQTIMFVQGNNEHSILWSGPRSSPQDVKRHFLIHDAYEWKYLEPFLKEEILSRNDNSSPSSPPFSSIYYDFDQNNCTIPKEIEKVAKPLAPIIHELRVIKSSKEQEIMKDAGLKASEAFKNVMSWSMKNNIRSEAQISARMEYECKSRGASMMAYTPVVAGGLRSNILHYVRNDMILMDAGGLFNNYCTDISRSWPISGKYTLAQKELYSALLRVQQGCLKVKRQTRKLIKYSIFLLLDLFKMERIDLDHSVIE